MKTPENTATTGPNGVVRGFIVYKGPKGHSKATVKVMPHPDAPHQPYMSAEEALSFMQSNHKQYPGDEMVAYTCMDGVEERISFEDMDTIYGSWAVAPASVEGGECGQPIKPSV